jgi:hypothetical protein
LLRLTDLDHLNYESPRYSVRDRPPPNYFTLFMPINITPRREVRLRNDWCGVACIALMSITIVALVVTVGTWTDIGNYVVEMTDSSPSP